MDASTYRGCEQLGRRPVIEMQNDRGNVVSPVTTVIPLTSRKKHYVPTHIRIPASITGAGIDSIAMIEQMRVVDKTRLEKMLGQIEDDSVMDMLGQCIKKNLLI